MKTTFIGALLLQVFITCSGQSPCSIEGMWIIAEGRIKKFELTNPYVKDRIEFGEDTVSLASGFFYQTRSIEETYPRGKFPFVYYGNEEPFRVNRDSLFIYRTPYEDWIGFKISCLKSTKILLSGKSGTLMLEKARKERSKSRCKIKFIELVLFSGPLDIYKVAYKVRYDIDDTLTFQPMDSLNRQDSRPVNIKVKRGTFARICQGFEIMDLKEIKPEYLASESDSKSAEIRIGLVDGSIIKTFIQDIYYDYPDELRLALIPVLYGHQQYFDSSPPMKLD